VPRLARWLAAVRVPPPEREFALGDLEEEFASKAHALGAAPARRWYWRQAARSFLRGRPPASTYRHQRRGGLMSGWRKDVVYAWRGMLSRPVVSLAALCSFALGIGANVAIFSVAWPVLFAPLPFADEGRLMKIVLTFERNNATHQHPLSTGDYVDLHGASSFSRTAAYNQLVRQMNLTGSGDAEQVTVGHVTPELFPVLGVMPLYGRLFDERDGEAGGVIVLNERLWRNRFGADPSIVGRVLRLDGVSLAVVGIMPSSAGLGTIDADGWLPQHIDLADRRRGPYNLGMVGRLKPAATREQAAAELAAIMNRVAVEFPQPDGDLGALVAPFRDQAAAPVRSTMVLLVVSAGLVLLIATVNLAGLQVARGFERGRELDVRRALGASRWHLVRQAMIEALTVSVLGGVSGVGVAWLVSAGLQMLAPTFGWQQQVRISPGLLAAYSVALTLVTGLAIGLLPAWRSSRSETGGSMQVRSMTPSRVQTPTRAALVATQVAIAAVLMVVAALVALSQRNVLALDPGFDPGSTIAADLSPPQGRFATTTDATMFFDGLLARITSLPGVESACVANEVPLDREPNGMTYVPEAAVRPISAWPNTITPACVDVLGLRLIAGRRLTNSEPTPSIMVSASMARALFPDGRDAVGQRAHFGVATGVLLTIVGVVADLRDGTLERSHGRQVWMPQSLGHFAPRRLLVRYRSTAAIDVLALRGVVRESAPDLALARVRPLSAVISKATAPRRFAMFLLSGFAVVAVLLCAVGLYGVLAHSVGQRRQEIGIRMALGARPGQVLPLVATQVFVAVGVGLVAGLSGARALSDTVRSLLFGITATDSTVYVGVGGAVLLMAVLAAWAPMRLATRIDPKSAMRAE
jgi:putative ABC transport system permease protein